jgi:hypothetical protein
MVESAKQLENYPDLIQGFDHLRAGKYFDPEKLVQAIQHTQTAELVETLVPEWAEFSREYQARLAPTQTITRVARFLKIFELSVLAAYVALIGVNLFQPTPWVVRALPGITLLVLVYFGFVYGLTFFLIEQPSDRYLKGYLSDHKKFAKNVYKLVRRFVEMLDAHLLEAGLSAADYGFSLYAKDYPGIFVTIRPGRVMGDRLFRAVPYPLHTIYAENRSRISILMDSYRDDRLLRSLADLEGKAQVHMVATSNISDHEIFRKAAGDIRHNHPHSTIMVMPPERGKRAVAVFTVDGVWRLSFGNSPKPNELKYAPVHDEELRKELEERFNQGFSTGTHYRTE